MIPIFLLTAIILSQGEQQGRITDREIIERLTRLEEGQKALNQRIDDMNTRIDDMNTSLGKRIDDLQVTMLWGFGILFTMIIALFGYIVWDRRTTLIPAIKKNGRIERK
ncbi:MAG: hypothetical protein HY769_09780 [Candidatus Stahlbacteria bacterium]|nr:hypothetical protein [Candidatus Stahlbacteria bacterium]